MKNFGDKNSVRPNFCLLADKCLPADDGIMTMINPTIALTTPNERRLLAERFHIHTILTCHQSGNVNMSQQTAINESIVVMRRHTGPKLPTRFINLDRMPVDDDDAADFHRCLLDCEEGLVINGWCEVSHWPVELMEEGDWTPAIWRSPVLAKAAAKFANHPELKSIQKEPGSPGSFPILKSKGAEGQTFIQSAPDEHWIPKKYDDELTQLSGGENPDTVKMLQKAGYLLITAGQDNSTARLTATASDEKYVGNGWMPVTGLSPQAAKAVAVFVNSTVGRLQLMRNPGRKIEFPTYSAAEAANIRIPNIKDDHISLDVSSE